MSESDSNVGQRFIQVDEHGRDQEVVESTDLEEGDFFRAEDFEGANITNKQGGRFWEVEEPTGPDGDVIVAKAYTPEERRYTEEERKELVEEWHELPKVGSTRAEKLFDKYGPLEDVEEDDLDDLTSISRLGDSTAEAIRNAIFGEEDEEG